MPPGPDRHSIDYFYQLLKDEHFNPRCYSNDPELVGGKEDGVLHLPGRFSSELEAEAIVDYLSNTRQQRNPDKPFFMVWAMNPPHNPWTAEHTYMDFFDQYGDLSSGKGDLDVLLQRENADSTVGDYAPYYFTNVTAVDHFIKQVLERFAALGLEEGVLDGAEDGLELGVELGLALGSALKVGVSLGALLG